MFRKFKRRTTKKWIRRNFRNIGMLTKPKPMMKFMLQYKRVKPAVWLNGWGNDMTAASKLDFFGIKPNDDAQWKNVLGVMKNQYVSFIINKIVVQVSNVKAASYFVNKAKPTDYVVGKEAPEGLTVDSKSNVFAYAYTDNSATVKLDSELLRHRRKFLKINVLPRCKKHMLFSTAGNETPLSSWLSSMECSDAPGKKSLFVCPKFRGVTDVNNKNWLDVIELLFDFDVRVYCTASGRKININI